MAEAVFQSLCLDLNSPISSIDSCGTAAYHAGSSPDARTMSTLESHGITTYRHRARQVLDEDFLRFDYVFAMDRENLRRLQVLRRGVIREQGGVEEGVATVMLVGDMGDRPGEVVVDPYGDGRDAFERVYQQMVRFSQGFLRMVDLEYS